MNKNLKEIVGSINKLTYLNNIKIINDKYVIKNNINKNIKSIYEYLDSRNFANYLKPIYINDNYEVYPYIESINMPLEEKALDIVYLLSILHSKTYFYRDIDISKNKKIYEDNIDNINYLYNYYNDLITSIESEVYMSPSSYLIARNIDIFFKMLNISKDYLNKWYKLVESSTSERVSYIHNNINLDHYLKSDMSYLISFNKMKVDYPILDLLNLYKNNYLNIDFINLLKVYENNFPLKEEERLLLFIYMMIPPKVERISNEYENCIKINKIIDYMYKTKNIIENYQKR